MRILILILSVLLTSCATHYTHPTKTEMDLNKDRINCKVKLAQSNVHPFAARSFMHDCMNGEGWSY